MSFNSTTTMYCTKILSYAFFQLKVAACSRRCCSQCERATLKSVRVFVLQVDPRCASAYMWGKLTNIVNLPHVYALIMDQSHRLTLCEDWCNLRMKLVDWLHSTIVLAYFPPVSRTDHCCTWVDLQQVYRRATDSRIDWSFVSSDAICCAFESSLALS